MEGPICPQPEELCSSPDSLIRSPAAQGEFEGSGVAAAGYHVRLQREPSWENERME